MDETNKHVVIVGGGFAGLRTALDLLKQNLPLEITLINKEPFHEYHPDLYEVAAAFLPETGDKKQKKLRYQHLEGTVAIPLKQIFENKKIKIVIETVNGVSLDEKLVNLENGEKVKYDFLVIALGSVTNFFGMTKLEEKSLPLKNTNDALNIRDSIDELFLSKKRDQDIRIVIGGGGFTGCELAGEISRYSRELAQLHNHPKEKIKVSVVEASPNLLSGTKKWFQEKAFFRLQKLGVAVHTNSRIVDLEEQKLILESGEKVDFDILIWTAGVRANPLVAEIAGIKLEKNSSLSTDQCLRSPDQENVFALGDNCFCFDINHTHPMPPTAQLAMAQGEITARNIANILKGREMEIFKPKLPTFIVPIGRNYALTEVYGIALEGVLAWWLKRIVALRYLLSILPLRAALQAWWGGVSFELEMEK